MSYFDDASLVMIPSGYKTSKVYSVKPTSGDGDLTFTRSNDTATRVNSAGLIEKVRTNLQTYSQDFTNAVWTDVDFTSVTTNYGTAPDGTQTSNRVVLANLTNAHMYAFKVFASGQDYTFSVWYKGTAGEKTYINSVHVGSGGSSQSKLITFTGDWQRESVTVKSGATLNYFYPIDTRVGSDDTATDFEIWGAQLETGDIATDYIETTTAAVSVGPVANVPRLDYLGSSCPRLLLEPQTTALNQFSESFDNSYWQLKTDVTIEANTTETLDPAGYYGAEKITETATTARHRVASNITNISTVNHTASVFMKKGTARYGFVSFAATTVYTIIVDLEDGTITATSTSGTIVAQKVEDYGNGWYRISVTGLSAISGGPQYALQFGSAGSAVPSSYIGNIPSFAGSTSNYLYAWGANLTATSYVQSYIPTLGAAVTRGADAASKTGISSLIGQTEGTFYLNLNREGVSGSAGFQIVNINDGSTANRLRIVSTEGVELRILFRLNGNVTQYDVSTTSAFVNAIDQQVKIAVAYKSGDIAVYINGQLFNASSDTLTFSAPLTDYELGDGANGLILSEALLFKTRLSNADLAALTA